MVPKISIIRLAIFLLTTLYLPEVKAQASPNPSPDNAECLACHEDSGLTGIKAGHEISVFVSEKELARSIHKNTACIDCHLDLAQTDLPHNEDVLPAQCQNCHQKQTTEHNRSLHGQAFARGDKLAPQCADCHGSHGILSKRNPASPTAVLRVPYLCGRCHHEGSPVSLTHAISQDRILENYSFSIHGEGLFKRGLTVSAVCSSCHTAHNILPHTDARSSIARTNVAKTCTQCHGLIEEVHQKVIEGQKWEQSPGQIPVCVDCHSPHKIRRVFYSAGVANADCMTCHANPKLSAERAGQTISMFVDEKHIALGAHREVACAQCHSQLAPDHERPCLYLGKHKVDCSTCHAEVVREYKGGVHGSLSAKGDPDAPNCLTCHERHYTKSKKDPTSETFVRNVPELCGSCHRDGQKAALRIHSLDSSKNAVDSYQESVHGKGLLESGLLVTATCSDCHTAHKPLPADDPQSSVYPSNVTKTCGKCHHGIEEVFEQSVHSETYSRPYGRSASPTGKTLPTCEDCHTSHAISRTDLDAFRFKIMGECGRCHEAEADTFFDTHHGKASQLGSAKAAKCSDCHGTHSILPPNDPDSSLSRANVVQTCANCHPGSHRRFAGYLTHATHHDRHKYPFLFWSFWGMTALLVGTLSFALLHTLAWLIRLWRVKKDWQPHKARLKDPTTRYYQRFSPTQRRLHLVLLLSFFTLALTGMTLKFAFMPWAQILATWMGGFGAMRITHRLGALVLIIVFLIHLYGLYAFKREHKLTLWQLLWHPNSMMFTWTDIKEVKNSILWFLGRGPRPNYGRYTYWEKFDYFAVFWGVVVIGSTGLVLWFPELWTHLLPGWAINVATIIHSDEALLAVGFIFTVHFFNTHFRPDKFPMDPVIFTGLVSVDELKYDKPREYQNLVETGDLESQVGLTVNEKSRRFVRVFGMTALTVGLCLLALILYSMIFAYR